MNSKLSAWCGAAVIAAAACGATCRTYNAALGTLPDEQGWSVVTSTEGGPYSASVEGGVLLETTMPFANPTCPGPPEQQQYIYWIVNDAFNFADGASFEVEARVNASEYGINPCSCCLWARPGFSITMVDSAGHLFWVGIGESKVFLADDPYLAFGSPGIVEALFTSTNGFHLYRLQVVGSSAQLLIDGNPVLSLSAFGPTQTFGPNAYVGDVTGWTNSEVQIHRFIFSSGPSPTPDLNCDARVDGDDLGTLLGQWGACPGCPADFNDDGVVDGDDLGELLGAWT